MQQDLAKMYHCAQILFLQEMQSPFMSQLCWQWHLESSRINTTLLISHLTARWVTLFVGRFRIVTIMASFPYPTL